MCVGQYSRLRVDVVVVTPFYTLVCVLSSYFSPVALQIIICLAPSDEGVKKFSAYHKTSGKAGGLRINYYL